MTEARPPGNAHGAVSFDLFGTLVAVTKEAEPSRLVRTALEARGVAVPDNWPSLYATQYADRLDGAEISLIDHVSAALDEGGLTVDPAVVRRAVIEAFDPDVTTRPGAADAVAAIADRVPVGVLSNCSVPAIADRALDRSAIDRSRFDAVVTSEACGWRKPDHRAFRAIADALGVEPAAVLHVGDDPIADTGIEQLGGTAVLVDDVSLQALPDYLEPQVWHR